MSDSEERGHPLERGYSIQGAVVFTNHGHMWREFESHAAAKAAVEGFVEGYEWGKKVGYREAQANMRSALGVS